MVDQRDARLCYKRFWRERKVFSLDRAFTSMVAMLTFQHCYIRVLMSQFKRTMFFHIATLCISCERDDEQAHTGS